jgi:hypothetical protein
MRKKQRNPTMTEAAETQRTVRIRFSLRTALIAVALVAALATLVGRFVVKEPHWADDATQLQLCHAVIEAKFGQQLSLIRQKSVELDESDRHAVALIHEDLRVALSLPEVYAAHWSWDGHHGLDTLVSADGEEWGWFCESASSRSSDGSYTLFWGESDDGIRLVLYEGIVPNGSKRVFRVAFRHSQILPKQQRKRQ